MKIFDSKKLPAWLLAVSGLAFALLMLVMFVPGLFRVLTQWNLEYFIFALLSFMALGIPGLALPILLVQELKVEPRKADELGAKRQLLKIICLTATLLALSLFAISFLSYTALSWAVNFSIEVNMFLETASVSLLLGAGWIWLSGKLANRAFALGKNWNHFFVLALCFPPLSWLAVFLVTFGKKPKP